MREFFYFAIVLVICGCIIWSFYIFHDNELEFSDPIAQRIYATKSSRNITIQEKMIKHIFHLESQIRKEKSEKVKKENEKN